MSPASTYLREYAAMRFFEEFVRTYHGERSQGGRKGVPVQNITAWGISAVTDGELWYFSRLPGLVGPVLLLHNQVLMLKDALYARYNVLIANDYLYPHNSYESVIRRQWLWQEECLVRYGNEGYELAKSTESLSKTYMSRLAECPLSGADDSFEDMITKVQKKEEDIISLRYHKEEDIVIPAPIMAKKLAELLTRCRDLPLVVELFGLQKCTGHPLIDPVRGGLSAAKEARSQDETRYEDAISLRNSWVRIFIESYVKRHGRYPEFAKSPERGSELHRLWRLNQLNLHRTSYPLTDLTNVVLAQHFEFDYYTDYLQLLDDKAISFKRSERHLYWEKADDRKASSSVRLLIEVISRPHISPEAIVSAVEEGCVPLDWLLVSITPKEREFKLSPRMFAMFVFEMRHFFTMHEANLAATILPYIPQLTMTDSRSDIQDRFLDLTKTTGLDDRLNLLLEFDLSRWNLRWRSLCVDMVGKDLNDLFGMRKVFTTGHSFFTDALISVRVPGLKPSDADSVFPPDSSLEWGCHLGGFEGILQKLWSIATVAMMDLALRDLEIAYTWTIQGDNVTAIITLPPTPPGTTDCEFLRIWQDRILLRAEDATSRVNQDLKREECTASTKVITYSKDVYILGSEYYTTLKFFSRIFPVTADDFPSVASQLSSIYAGCVAAAERTRHSPVGYFIALHHGCLYLSRVMRYDRCYTSVLTAHQRAQLNDSRVLQYMILLPSELGGLASLSLLDFFYKGGADPLARSLASVHLLRPYLSTAERIYRESFFDGHYEKKPTIRSLVKDPRGLPVKKPISPADAVAEGTRTVLFSCAKNPDIRDVMSPEIKQWDQLLCEHLGRVQPYIADMMHDLWRTSVAGRAEALSRTFTATRSLQALAKDHSETDLVLKVIKQARAQIIAILLRAKTIQAGKVPPEVKDLYTWTRFLRHRYWAPTGTIPEGVDSHHPLDFKLHYLPDNKISGVSLMAQYPANQDNSYTRGPFPPYKGGKTREKKSHHGFTIITDSASARAVKDQQKLRAFARGNTQMEKVIDICAKTRTDVNLGTASQYLMEKDGGNNVHRYRSQLALDSAYILGQANNCTYTALNTDRIEGLSASTKDYPLMLQEHQVFLQAVAALRRVESHHTTEYDKLILEIREDMLDELPQDSLVLDGDVTLPVVSLYANPLVYVPEITMKQISGPIKASEFPLHTCEEPDITIALAALKSIGHKSLGQISELVGSGGTIVARSEQLLDILELKMLGLERVLQVFSLILAERTVVTLSQQWSDKRLRAASCLITLKQGPRLISSIRRYLRHPSMRRDELVQRKSILPGPIYQGRQIDEARVLAHVTQTTLEMLLNVSSPLYNRECVLFESDQSEGLSRELELQVYLVFLKHRLIGELPESEVLGCVTSLRKSISMFPHTAEMLRQSRIYALLLIWSEGFSQHYPSTSKALLQLARAPKISLARMSATVAIRKARLLVDLEAHRTSVARPLITSRPQAVPNPATYTPYPTRVASRSSRETWASSVWGSPLERTFRDISYNRSMMVACGSSALSAWWSAGELGRGRDIVMIGAGHGASSLSFLSCGARSVLGLDLRDDLPKEEALTEDYVPPLVERFSNRDSYLQSSESFTTSGDWFSLRTYRSLIRKVPTSSLVVIDIQGERGYSPEALTPLLAMNWSGDYLLRWQGGLDALSSVVGTVQSVSKSLTIYSLRQYSSHRDILIKGTISRGLSLVPSRVMSVSPWYLHTALPPVFFDYAWTFDVLFRPIGGPPSYNLKVATDTALRIIDTLAGEYTTRPSYSSWTQILHVGVCCKWLQCDQTEQDQVIKRLHQGEDYDLQLYHHSLRVKPSDILIRIITHLAARLLPIQDG
jgi:hypothetical protein